MDYFKDCKNADDVKRLYRELAKKLHPDHGGKKEDMAELNKQYNSWKPSEFRQNMGDKVRENIREQVKEWGKEFENKSYGGYGGYKYNTNANMRQEYYNQRDDPRLGDYERMKTAYQEVCNNLNNANIEIRQLSNEIIILKKKAQTQKRQLDKLKNMPKNAKKPTKRSSKRSVISL